jgi:hypothetical protein
MSNTTTPDRPFDFDFGDDGPSLKAAVYQALGAASVCWESMNGTGIFQDQRAVEIGERLIDFIRQENNA